MFTFSLVKPNRNHYLQMIQVIIISKTNKLKTEDHKTKTIQIQCIATVNVINDMLTFIPLSSFLWHRHEFVHKEWFWLLVIPHATILTLHLIILVFLSFMGWKFTIIYDFISYHSILRIHLRGYTHHFFLLDLECEHLILNAFLHVFVYLNSFNLHVETDSHFEYIISFLISDWSLYDINILNQILFVYFSSYSSWKSSTLS